MGQHKSKDVPITSLKQAIVIVSKIGEGSFGRVDCVILHNKHFALKTVSKARFFRSSDKSFLAWNERDVMIACNPHPFVVSLECCFQDADHVYFLSPLYPGGDLLQRVQARYETKGKKQRKNPGLKIEHVRFYLAALVLALEQLHSESWCHRDIKPANVFLDHDGYPILGDLGLAVKINKDDPVDDSRFWGTCGSVGFRAPEVVNDESCGFAADIYALGVTGFILAYGKFPWADTAERLTLEKKTGKDSLQFPKVEETFTSAPESSVNERRCLYRKGLQLLLAGMLAVDPQSRTTPVEMRQHSFFDGIDWKKLSNRAVPAAVKVRKPVLPALPTSTPTPAPSSVSGSERKSITEEQQESFNGFEFMKSYHELDRVLRFSDLSLQDVETSGTSKANAHSSGVEVDTSDDICVIDTVDLGSPKVDEDDVMADLPAAPPVISLLFSKKHLSKSSKLSKSSVSFSSDKSIEEMTSRERQAEDLDNSSSVALIA